jgi:dTDP-4-dehydrorhamnose 3,5-epimerase
VRGLHYQLPPHAEAKIITCLSGAILDVIVDIRLHSPTFLKHIGIPLEAGDDKAIFVPRGFAHGFQTLVPETELLYLHDNFYNQQHERGLLPIDPALMIRWPREITQISSRDLNHQRIDRDFQGLPI